MHKTNGIVADNFQSMTSDQLPKPVAQWLRKANLGAALSPVLILCITLFNCLFPAQPAQASDPLTHWETLETDHFRIVFDSRHYQLANRYARFAEQAFAVTTPVFKIWPEKTVIFIDDSTDIANGAASGVPYPLINARPVLPSALETVGDYGNWGLELLTHEYTHILTFEPATGWIRPFRTVFGTIIRPNMWLPTWYLEGLAVEMETRYSTHGRLRSANFLSIPRALVEENQLEKEDIARINEVSLPDWPRGARPYLMGSLLWNEMVRLGGEKVIGDLNLSYSRRLPFLINGPPESLLGLNYAQLLAQVYKRTTERARTQLAPIAAAGPERYRKVKSPGYFSFGPRVSPDGNTLVWIGKTHNFESIVIQADRDVAKPEADAMSFVDRPGRILFDGIAINRLSWLPDSTGFIYDSNHNSARYYDYSDLWRYDLKRKKSHQITRGLRSREPAVRADSKFIVFVQNYPGGNRLASIDMDGGHYTSLYSPEMQIRLENPEFLSPDEIIFSEKSEAGVETFKRLKLAVTDGRLDVAEAPVELLASFKPVHFPRLTSKGLLFVSDRTGVANLYLANAALTDAKAVSNTSTQTVTGEIDPVTGELYYGRLTASGADLVSASEKDWKNSPIPPQVAGLIEDDWPHFAVPELEVKPRRTSYNPFGYLLPRYWMPYGFYVPGGVYISASTSAADPAERHAYSLAVSYDTLTKRPSVFGQYMNHTSPVQLLFTGADLNEYIYSADFTRHSTQAGLIGTTFIPGMSQYWRLGAGWQYLQSQVENRVSVRNGPKATLSYSHVTQTGLEISPERGGSFSLTQTHYLQSLGNTHYDQTDILGAFYFSKWFPDRHVLALSVSASIAPRLDDLNLGQTTIGGSYQTNLVSTGLLMRGYNSGVFLGRSLVTTTAEYRFPISYAYRGFGTLPFFLSRWHGALFVDSVTLDGAFYDASIPGYRAAKLGKFFIGTGGEVRADTTLFYRYPVQFIGGLYYGTDRRANPGGLLPYIGIGL